MERRHSKFLIALGLAAVCAWLATPAMADEKPYTKADDAWISISGTVESVTPDTFVLDYGDGSITVEMDDGDRDADAYVLVAGDGVTVHGRIDDDLFEKRTIEASSVYVETLDTYFFASSDDEEDYFVTSHEVMPSHTVVQGRVIDVNMNDFTIDTGLNRLTVELDRLGYDPLDDEGYLKVETGDRVSVSGELEVDFFEGRIIEATSLTKLYSI